MVRSAMPPQDYGRPANPAGVWGPVSWGRPEINHRVGLRGRSPPLGAATPASTL